jgi:RNA polymerase sigma-70 factor (ECF subfamily)
MTDHDRFTQALGKFLRENQLYLRGIANRLAPSPSQADDLAQEALLIAVQKADTFDFSRSLRAWLVGILRNVCRRAWEKTMKEDRRSRDDLGMYMEALAEEPSPVMNEKPATRLEQCLEKLSEQGRRVLHLRYTLGRKTREIARETGRKPEVVSVTLYRLREQLRKCMLDIMEEAVDA